MNNFGSGFGLTGVQGLVQGEGIVCSPNPISRTGVISLSPSVTTAIKHITTEGDSTIIDSSLVIHGPIVAENIITPSTNLNALARP